MIALSAAKSIMSKTASILTSGFILIGLIQFEYDDLGVWLAWVILGYSVLIFLFNVMAAWRHRKQGWYLVTTVAAAALSVYTAVATAVILFGDLPAGFPLLRIALPGWMTLTVSKGVLISTFETESAAAKWKKRFKREQLKLVKSDVELAQYKQWLETRETSNRLLNQYLTQEKTAKAVLEEQIAAMEIQLREVEKSLREARTGG